MGKIARSWDLVKSSWRVLRSDKELLLIPVLAGIVAALAIAIIAGGYIAITGNSAGDIPEKIDENSNTPLELADFIALILIYFVTVLIATFFNAALVAATLKRLRGGDPTVGDGLRIAASRIWPILGYTAIAATVGVILQIVRSRFKVVGQLGAGILGAAWGVLTFLVVPVLVAEDVGPTEAIERSGSLLKKTWGEQIAGNFGLGLITFLVVLATGAVGVVLIVLADSAGSDIATGGAIALLVIAMAIVAVIFTALGAIFKAAVYEYAAEDLVAREFGSDVLSGAFVAK
jgi:Family of unknown function (DUF6159)